MLILVVLVLTTAVLAYSLVKSCKFDPTLVESSFQVTSVGVQIICGDCSGDEALPKKTFLDLSGRCHQCGGTSYVLAAHRAPYAERLMNARASKAAGQSAARVLRYPTGQREDWEAASASLLGGVA